MTGFEVPQTQLRLVFSDPSYAGLEVVCALPPLDKLEETAAIAADPAAVTPDTAARLLDTFAEQLVSWNLTRNGEPVPATRAGLGSLDLLFAMQLIMAWLSSTGELLKQQRATEAALELPVTPAS